MTNEFTAIVERDGVWFVAYCAEIPGANGQGRTSKAAVESLAQAIKLLVKDQQPSSGRNTEGVLPNRNE